MGPALAGLVEAVASRSRPNAASPGQPAHAGASSAARVLTALRSASLRASLCDGLRAFNLSATQAAPEQLVDVAGRA